MMKALLDRLFQKEYSEPWIKFHSDKLSINSFPNPVPSNKLMPEWFKVLKPQVGTPSKINAGTVKKCMPVMDSVSNGFIIPLWCDLAIVVSQGYSIITEDGKMVEGAVAYYDKSMIGKPWIEGGLKIKHFVKCDELVINTHMSGVKDQDKAISRHGWEQVGEACDLKKFKIGKDLLKFQSPWSIETPKGYSVQFKNPSNNWSTDIEILEGIVDTDEFYTPVNFPFVWKGNKMGEFLIPQGTPLVQVVPFKREKYEIEVGERDEDKYKIGEHTLVSRFQDRYKNLFWHKRKK
jgi:hypothetical protein